MKKIEIDLPEIEGFEYTGEYRAYKNGEFYLSSTNQATKATCSGGHSHWPILKKKAPAYKTTTTATHREVTSYVEIKALEHAMGLVDKMILDLKNSDADLYNALADLIK